MQWTRQKWNSKQKNSLCKTLEMQIKIVLSSPWTVNATRFTCPPSPPSRWWPTSPPSCWWPAPPLPLPTSSWLQRRAALGARPMMSVVTTPTAATGRGTTQGKCFYDIKLSKFIWLNLMKWNLYNSNSRLVARAMEATHGKWDFLFSEPEARITFHSFTLSRDCGQCHANVKSAQCKPSSW